jgi:hypothetical protein
LGILYGNSIKHALHVTAELIYESILVTCDSINDCGGGAHLRQAVGDKAEHGRGLLRWWLCYQELGKRGRSKGESRKFAEALQPQSGARRWCGEAAADDVRLLHDQPRLPALGFLCLRDLIYNQPSTAILSENSLQVVSRSLEPYRHATHCGR